MLQSAPKFDSMYDDGATSVAASLESLDHDQLVQNQATLSMFHTESEPESDHSSTPWSPPAWRKGTSGWQQRHNLPPSHNSRLKTHSNSPRWGSTEEGDDTILPTRIPLPASPEKDTPRHSIEPTPDVSRPTGTPNTPGDVVDSKRSTTRPRSATRATSPPTQPSENCMHSFFLILMPSANPLQTSAWL
jgi:hypothetical protein